jgi:hypothetical protein
MVKTLSLFQVCVPFAPRGVVVYPLLVVASLELVLGAGSGTGLGSGRAWWVENRLDSYSNGEAANRRERAGFVAWRRMRLVTGFRLSVLLMVAHVVVLVMVMRWDVLCLKPVGAGQVDMGFEDVMVNRD